MSYKQIKFPVKNLKIQNLKRSYKPISIRPLALALSVTPVTAPPPSASLSSSLHHHLPSSQQPPSARLSLQPTPTLHNHHPCHRVLPCLEERRRAASHTSSSAATAIANPPTEIPPALVIKLIALSLSMLLKLKKSMKYEFGLIKL